MARILVSGASGFIGKPLLFFLHSLGHSVTSLTRHPIQTPFPSILWDPAKKKANSQEFEHFDIVIHLAGDPLTLSRWSRKKREAILKSRVEATTFLSHLLSSAKHPPSLFLSASAVGYYGNRGEEILTEESGPGTGFLSEVCLAWEKASLEIQKRGVRCVFARFGMVLAPDGGALRRMLPIYRLGLGASLGAGEQWLSWVHREDLLRSFAFIIEKEELTGAVNIVSPHPVRQKAFSLALAKSLHRPHFLTLPAPILRLFLGITADELLLASTRVKCAKLLNSNFLFHYPDINDCFACFD
jgi:uncharacterized protein (TIGR01777 family)